MRLRSAGTTRDPRNGRWKNEVVGIFDRGAIACREDVVDGAAGPALSAQPDAAGHVRLGIDVDEQDVPASRRQCGREVDDGGGLPHAAFLIGDGEYLIH